MRAYGFKLINDDESYVVIQNEDLVYAPYGSILASLANIELMQVKRIIMACPFFDKKWDDGLSDTDEWLQNAFAKEFGMSVEGIILAAIASFAAKLRSNATVAYLNTYAKDFPQLNEIIFRDTGFKEYGNSTIGHELVSSLFSVGSGLALIKKVVNDLADKKLDSLEGALTNRTMGETVVPCQFLILSDEIRTVYVIDCLEALLLVELSKIFEQKIEMKRCENCGRFFVPENRSDEIYCSNPSPQDFEKTCKQYGSEKLWYERLKNNETAKLSRNIYSSKRMLAVRNPDIEAYTKMFEYFKAERKKWESDLKHGARTKEEYICWLNEMKKKKTL